MRYWKVSCDNGYCGCDEEWLMKTEKGAELTSLDVFDAYGYTDGAAGLSPKSEEDEDFDPDSDVSAEEYEENIFSSMAITEISEEEFINLRDNEYWEVRG